MRRLLAALAAIVGTTAAWAEEGGAGWVRPEPQTLGTVYGLRRLIPISEAPPLLSARPEQWVGPLLSTDSTLTFVGPESGGLFALWTGSGRVLWKRPDLGRAGLGMAQVGDVLVVGIDSALVGLEGYSGKEQWRTELGAVVGGPITVTASVAIVPVRPNGYLAINGLTGAVKWRLKRPKPDAITVRGQAAAEVDRAAGRVYVGTSVGEVLALSLDTGGVLWTARLASPKTDEPFPDLDTQPLLLDGGRTVLAASYNGGMASLDAATGAVRWARPDLKHVTGLTHVDGSAWVVASVGDGQVVGVDPVQGHVRWRYRLQSGVPTAPIGLEHGLVAIGGSRSALTILDGATGEPRQLVTPGSGISAPLHRRGRELVAWTNKGHLMLLRLGEGTSVNAL